MSDEKIEYEPVPLDKLQEHDAFHAKITEPTSSLEAVAAAVAGKGALEVAKVTPGVKRLTEMFGKTPPVFGTVVPLFLKLEALPFRKLAERIGIKH